MSSCLYCSGDREAASTEVNALKETLKNNIINKQCVVYDASCFVYLLKYAYELYMHPARDCSNKFWQHALIQDTIKGYEYGWA